jgi:HK97 family phage prohead protease
MKKMPYREEREYRNMPMMETRAAGEGEEQSFVVEGYATTFEPYTLFEMDGIQYKEQIMPDAFEEADLTDVIFVKDHEGTVFARTKNGSLTLSVDNHGLMSRADLGRTSAAREMHEEIEAKMYTQMSFAFTVAEDSYDSEKHLRKIRRIKKLYDVSAVSFPANPGTDISVATRSRFDGFIEQEKAERLAKEAKLAAAREKYFYERSKKQWN